MSTRRPLLLCGLLAWMPSFLPAQVFRPGPLFDKSPFTAPTILAAGDVDGDRDVDLVAFAWPSTSLAGTLLLGTGTGAFTPSTTPVPLPPGPVSSLRLEDLDGL